MDPEHLAPIRLMVQKLRHFLEVTDRQTHGHRDGWTDTQKEITSVPLQQFFLHKCECEGEGGKLYKPYKIFTSSLREGQAFIGSASMRL